MLDSGKIWLPMAPPPISGRIRFGVFEVDLSSGELRKQGIKIKIHDQPFQVLAELLEHPGQVITRERLCEKLWPRGTFVDSEVGLNSAVKKLRDALGDSAENPRFVETLPRRGYRLIVEVEDVGVGHLQNPKSATDASETLRVGLVHDERGHAERAVPQQTAVDGPGKSRLDLESSPRRVINSQVFYRRKAAIAVAILVVVTAGSWWLMRPKPGPYTIAVLPFKNLSSEPDSDYFSDGLTDEIISNLSVINGLEVKSRTSSFVFKNQPRDIRVVGAQLGATLVLEGSVLRAGDKLRINARLVRASDDSPLWSGSFDRELKDVFAIQDEISRSIVNELRLNLGRGQRRYNTSLDAYDDYLKAEALLNRMPGSDSETIATSIPLFEEAIAKDPSFAPAYAGIADAYANLSTTPRVLSGDVAYPKMRAACENAMHVDPLLPEAYACMGLVYSRDRAWADAEQSFRRALNLNPNLSRQRQDFASWVLLPVGRLNEALRELRTALKLDPLSARAINFLDFALIISGHNDEVLGNSRRFLATNPTDYSAQQLSGRALVQEGKIDEGIAIFEKLGFGSESFLGYAYAKSGRRDDAEKIAAQHRDLPWVQAVVYCGLGDKDRAYEGLKQMVAAKDPRVGNYLQFPELSLLRGDPRMEEIRRSLSLPQLP